MAWKPPRLAYRVPKEAADARGVSPDFFDEHCVGHLVFVAVSELERWRLRRFDPSGCAV